MFLRTGDINIINYINMSDVKFSLMMRIFYRKMVEYIL